MKKIKSVIRWIIQACIKAEYLKRGIDIEREVTDEKD